MSPARVRRIVELAEGWVAQGVHPALVVLVARRNAIVVHEAFGRQTPATDTPPLELDAIFPVASLTKPVVATCAMILVEDGLLGLNRPVTEYLPEFTGEGKEAVMVYHLLTHTSGLRDEEVDAHAEKKGWSHGEAVLDEIQCPPRMKYQFLRYRGSMPIPLADDTQHPLINEYLYFRYDAPLWKPPGVEMSYCNYGYCLIGEIVRRISGKPLEQFAREKIFGPLDMKDSGFIVTDSVRSRMVRRAKDGALAFLDNRLRQETPWANGGMHSTAVDMAIFGQMFLNNGAYGRTRILSPASTAAMTRNQIPGVGAHYGQKFFPEASWGLGWGVLAGKNQRRRGSLQSAQAFAHGGAGGVFLLADPIHEMVLIYFSVALGNTCLDLFMNSVTSSISDLESANGSLPV